VEGIGIVWERLRLTGLYIKVYTEAYWKVFYPVVLWLSVAWYFDLSIVATLLVFIAVSINGLGLAVRMQQTLRDALKPQTKRDFYVVIDANYKWNILRKMSRPGDLKSDTLDMVYAFDGFEPARAMYEGVSKEHYRFEDCLPWRIVYRGCKAPTYIWKVTAMDIGSTTSTKPDFGSFRQYPNRKPTKRPLIAAVYSEADRVATPPIISWFLSPTMTSAEQIILAGGRKGSTINGISTVGQPT
jgi:hypothetical protein